MAQVCGTAAADDAVTASLEHDTELQQQ